MPSNPDPTGGRAPINKLGRLIQALQDLIGELQQLANDIEKVVEKDDKAKAG